MDFVNVKSKRMLRALRSSPYKISPVNKDIQPVIISPVSQIKEQPLDVNKDVNFAIKSQQRFFEGSTQLDQINSGRQSDMRTTSKSINFYKSKMERMMVKNRSQNNFNRITNQDSHEITKTQDQTQNETFMSRTTSMPFIKKDPL